jgi:MoxR-like ATPase
VDAIEVIGVVQRYRNVVLHGPPGTGKTWLFGQICSTWESVTGRPVADPPLQLTLHPSTAYEDIIDGLRPNPSGDPPFTPTLGVFAQACVDAGNDPDSDHLVLFDELNRANVPRVLGDLLTMLEPSKRARYDADAGGFSDPPGGSVTLAYSRVPFVVPSNLYLLATMNSSDRAIVSIDVAVRRRFAFVRTEPMPGEALVDVLEQQYGEKVVEAVAASVRIWDRLNVVLRQTLGPDSVLGHSYFFDLADRVAAAFEDSRRIPLSLWHETGALTGGSRNQFDLSMKGRINELPGALSFFFPEVEGDVDHGQVRTVDLDWDGFTYRTNTISYKPNNGTWRLNLNGKREDGEALTPIVRDLRDSIVRFTRLGTDHYLLEEISDDLEDLKEASSWDATSTRSDAKHYGFAGEVDTVNASSEIEAAWRFAVLPQLIETLALSDAEALGDPTLRAEWLHGVPVMGGDPQALAVFQDLDDFLSQFELALTMQGSGLMKRLSIVQRQSAPAAPQEVGAPNEETNDASGSEDSLGDGSSSGT